jgi:pyruvate dehydrogenase E1 component alpha subunit
VWRLPVVFVCENNGYMEYTPIDRVIPVERPAADRAGAYGLPPLVVDGNDVLAVRAAATAAIDAARSGEGPALIEAVTYRHSGHSVADPAAYRAADEVARWKERDPLLVHREAAVAAGVPAERLDAMLPAEQLRAADLAHEALLRPEPDPESAWSDMWSDGGSSWRS